MSMTIDDLIGKLGERRKTLLDELRKITEASEAANRVELTEDEQKRWKELVGERDADGKLTKPGEIQTLGDRISELQEQNRAEETAANAAKNAPAGRVGAEPKTYTRDTARQGTSFFRDVKRATLDADWNAAERLQRHMKEVADAVQFRDVGTGAFSGLTVPQYLTDMVAPARRAGRPTADIANQHPLPDDGMTVNISRVTTGSATAVQASENAAVQETDMDDTLLTVNVVTIAGMQDVSRQAVDRGTGIDEIVMQDLRRAYETNLDNQILNGSGSGGQHLGIRNVSGIVSVSYTDASPTQAEAYPKLFDLIQQIQSGVFLGISHFVMHPRRWWWFVAAIGTSFPLLSLNNTPTGAAGTSEGTRTYENGPAGFLAGVPVILDANLPTNLGGGTNEDVILGVTQEELHLWEDPDAPLFIRAEQVLANTLTVRFVAYGYSAFTAGRYPGAHGTITGTGLVTPTF